MDKLRLNTIKAERIVKIKVSRGTILAYTMGGNIRKLSFTNSINDFTTHDVRRVINLLNNDCSINTLWIMELATFLDLKMKKKSGKGS